MLRSLLAGVQGGHLSFPVIVAGEARAKFVSP